MTDRELWVVLPGAAISDLPSSTNSTGERDVLCLDPGLSSADRAFSKAARLLDASKILGNVLPEAREEFVDLLAGWPDQQLFGEQSTKEWLAAAGSSLWWLLEPSQKSPESAKTFSVLCVTLAVRHALDATGCQAVRVVGGDAFHVASLSKMCSARRLAFSAPSGRLSAGVWRLALRRARICVGLLAKRWLASRLPAATRDEATLWKSATAFHTWAPAQWSGQSGRQQDRYFVQVPEYLGRTGATCVYAASLGGVQPRELPSIASKVQMLPPEVLRRTVWLETEVGLVATVAPFADFRRWFQLERMVRRASGLRASFRTASGVDLSDVAIQELREAVALQLPRFLVLREQWRRFVNRTGVRQVVTILETYCYGRAVTWGARLADPDVRVVGLQHSPANTNQMFYAFRSNEVQGALAVPLPDLFLLHTRSVADQLGAAGIPPSRLVMAGSPRMDPLRRYRVERQTRRDALREGCSFPPDRRVVLLVGTIWPDETRRLLRWTFASLRADDVLALRLHPLGGDCKRDVAALSLAHPHVVVQRCDDAPFHLLLAAADVAIIGNSTSDTEASAIGCPVIKVSTALVEFSPMMGAAGVTVVRSQDELRAHLSGQNVAATTDVPLEAVLGPLDGSSTQRVAALLASAEASTGSES